MTNSNPQYLSEVVKKLGDFLPEFAPETAAMREDTRINANSERLTEFHRVMSGELDSILEVLDQYKVDEIPEEWRQVVDAVLFMAEADSPVVKWLPRYGVQELPDALDPRHFEHKQSFYDMLPMSEKTRMSTPPVPRRRQMKSV